MAVPDLAIDVADEYLAFAAELAEEVRPIALSYFRTPLEVAAKYDDSPVTVADRTIEAKLRERIVARFPSHGIYGEEMGIKQGDEFTWVIDPIDGTKSFITGFPLFGTLIGLTYDRRPFCGVIDIPVTGERWMARPGLTTYGGKAARASSCRRVAEARFYTTSPDGFAGADRDCFERLSRAAQLRRFGGDCYMYGMLASGHCDLILETGLQPYDYMALVPVLEQAGGRITDWQGAPLSEGSSGHVLASATAALHDEALALING
ncbi:histidinol-phosphatase [Rhodopseudomonas sp. B29]|uniref:histidinol-phosphatase n=1 Tax=Rhodopseudomonas sp. B29 TaxID=95607 RepID=UPI0003450BF6|nr:histidinol-phosphatase [Rhodopseudomonas sp. B29]